MDDAATRLLKVLNGLGILSPRDAADQASGSWPTDAVARRGDLPASETDPAA